MNKILIFLIILLLTLSCNQNKKSRNEIVEVPTIEISKKNIDDSNDHSEVINIIEVIKLETSEQSLIGEMSKILVRNEKFYIHDGTSNSILKFNAQGEFLGKLDKKGRGPGEYSELRDFDVDKNENIYILSYNKMLVFNPSFEFVEQLDFKVKTKKGEPFPAVLFSLSDNYTFLYRGDFGMRKIDGQSPALCCIGNSKKAISDYFPVVFKYPYNHQTFYRSGDNLYLTSTMSNDTIYKIENSLLKPYMFVDFGNKKLTEAYILNNRSDLSNKVENDKMLGGILRVYENEKYLCFRVHYGKLEYQAIYNMSNGKIKVLNMTEDNLPFPYCSVMGLIGSSFFSCVYSYNFVEGYRGSEKYSELLRANNITNIKDTDNPLIFKFSFNF